VNRNKTTRVLEKRAEKAESGDGAKGAPRHPVLYQINTRVWLTDLTGQLGTPGYEREGSSLLAEGLYVDLPPWGYHVFEITFIPVTQSEADYERSGVAEKF
jgi:hypothetical protein